MLIKTDSSSHWYELTGDGVVPAYDKSLKDARKDPSLVPSITTILRLLAKPGLESWKQTQCVLSALTLPRDKGESDDAFAFRVVADSQEHSKAAVGFGTAIHGYVESYLKGNSITPMDDKSIEYWPPVRIWIDENIKNPILIEEPVGNIKHGYAGRLDCLVELNDHRLALIDIKTQGTKKGKVVKYPEWAYQLGATWDILTDNYDIDVCMNLVVSSTEENLIKPVEWSFDDICAGEEVFIGLVSLWRKIKKLPWEGVSA
jgi:hypothetical protein